MKKKRILIYTSQFPNSNELDRGTFIRATVRSLSKEYDISVISPVPWFPRSDLLSVFPRYSRYSKIEPEMDFDGVKAYYPKYFIVPKTGAMHPALLFSATYRFVRRLHAKMNFDLVNGHWLFPDGVAVSWISRILGIPCVLSARGCDVNLYTTFATRRGRIVSALKASDHVTVVSRSLKEKLVGLGIDERNISHIPNGVDLDRFHLSDKEALREKHGVPKDSKVALYVGRLSEEKRVDLLINAVSRLKNTVGGLYVPIVGDGELRGECARLVENLHLGGTVKLIGAVRHEELPDWYGLADVLCLSSSREGMPNVILESLASGRPVVSSRVGAVPDVLDEHNGIMFPSGDVEAMGTGLLEAFRRDWDPARIRESVRRFTWRNVGERYGEVYESVLGDRHHGKIAPGLRG